MENCGDDGLSLLGADDAFANQYITLRVKKLDRVKLSLKLGGSTGAMASSALSLVDSSPKAALDIAMPFIRTEAAKYGVDLETTVSNVPPSKGGRAISEFWPGMVFGVIVGGSSLVIMKLLARLAGR